MDKKKSSILTATIAVSALAIIGKVLGFGREAIIAALFGATAETDAFFFAQSMPSMIFPAISYSIGIAFTSLYVKKRTENIEAGDYYASRIVSTVSLMGLILSAFGALIAPVIVPVFAPGFTGEQLTLSAQLTRLTMGGFFFTMLTYLLTAILNSQKIFIKTQIAAFTYDIVVVIGTLFIGKEGTMNSLTLIVVFAMLMQTVVLAVFLYKHFCFTPLLNPFHHDSKELILLSAPILLGNSITQINNIVDKMLASTLQEGTVSALSYARSLNSIVISVFVTSLSTVLYPTLTSNAANDNMHKFANNLIQSLKGLTFVLVPVCCITLFEASDVVKVVYGRGKFNEMAISATATVLAFYAPGFLFIGIREVLSRGFFAIQNSKVPARNSAIGVISNIVLSLILVRFMGVGGIALGTSVAALITAVLLMISVHKMIPEVNFKAFLNPFCFQLLGGMLICISLFICNKYNFIPGNALVRFIISTLIGGIVYCITIIIFDRKQIETIIGLIKSKSK